MDVGEILALIVIGALAGTAAASFMGRKGKKSGGPLRNTAIGVAGALVGGLVFRALDISLPDTLSAGISVADLIVAFVGAILVILMVDAAAK